MIAELLIRTISNLFFFALHLSGTGSFPPPLSAKRERECLLAMKNGDVNAKNELIEHNLRLVAHIIKKYYSSSVQQDDLISIGTIGLIKAINTFDPDKGTRLATYAARCIENAILSQASFMSSKASFFPKKSPVGAFSIGFRTIFTLCAVKITMVSDILRCFRLTFIYHPFENLPKQKIAYSGITIIMKSTMFPTACDGVVNT